MAEAPVTISECVCASATGNCDYLFWGCGTESNPFIIANYDDLDRMRKIVNYASPYNTATYQATYNASGIHYLQIADIDVASESGGSSGNWCVSSYPCIGYKSTYPFKAHYDGGEHSVTRLYTTAIDSTGSKLSAGLFGYANGAVIENLSVSGYLRCNHIMNVGGLVGETVSSAVSIVNCTTNVRVTNAKAASYYAGYGAGGVVGKTSVSTAISHCLNLGAVSDSANSRYGSLGGILGVNKGTGTTISYCSNAASIETQQNSANGYGWVGGICARSMDADIAIDHCSNSGSLSAGYNTYTADLFIGGILGLMSVTGTSNRTATISNCNNSGSLSALYCSRGYVGGIIGASIGQSSSPYYKGIADVSDCVNSGVINGCTANEYSSWYRCSGGIMGRVAPYGQATLARCTNNATITNTRAYCKIGGILGELGQNAYATTIQDCSNTSDITLSVSSSYLGGIVGYCYGTNPTAVENCSNGGNLTSNGNGYTGGIIGYIYYSSTTTTFSGSVANTGAISALYRVGGIMGNANGTVVFSADAEVTNSAAISSTSTSTGYTGGIAGHASAVTYNDGVTMSNSGTVTAACDRVGGLFGNVTSVTPSSVTTCRFSNSGPVSGTVNVGGLIGYIGTGRIKYASNTADISATKTNSSAFDAAVGGIIGQAYGTGGSDTINLSDSFNSGGITSKANGKGVGGIIGYARVNRGTNVFNCYNTGYVGGSTQTYVGGIVGMTNTSTITIRNCYSNTVFGSANSRTIATKYSSGTLTITNCYANDNHGGYNSSATLFNTSTGALATAQTVNSISCTTLREALHNWVLANGSYSDWEDAVVPRLSWEL